MVSLAKLTPPTDARRPIAAGTPPNCLRPAARLPPGRRPGRAFLFSQPTVIPAQAGIRKSLRSSIVQAPGNGKTHRFPANRKTLGGRAPRAGQATTSIIPPYRYTAIPQPGVYSYFQYAKDSVPNRAVRSTPSFRRKPESRRPQSGSLILAGHSRTPTVIPASLIGQFDTYHHSRTPTVIPAQAGISASPTGQFDTCRHSRTPTVIPAQAGIPAPYPAPSPLPRNAAPASQSPENPPNPPNPP